MNLDQTTLDKMDAALREKLALATEDEVIRAVILLDPETYKSKGDQTEGQESAAEAETDLDPAHFASRLEYRKALISKRQEEMRRGVGPTLQALAALSLNPRGGRMGSNVVVEGMASQIMASLHLPGVRHAALDQPIMLTPHNQY